MEMSCLTEIKAILKSLVLSSTDKMTVEQLNRDYRDTEGEWIPFRRLGYASIEDLFQAIPDTLRVFGSGPTAIVCFVANNKSDHIHDMIMRQKKPRTRVRNRNRTRTRANSSANNRYTNKQMPNKKISSQQLSPFQNVDRHRTVKTVKVWNEPQLKSSSPSNFTGLPQPSGIVSQNNTKDKESKTNNLNKYEEEVCNLLKKSCIINRHPPPLPLSNATKNCSIIKENTKADHKIKESLNGVKRTSSSTESAHVNNSLSDIKPPKAKEKSQQAATPSSHLVEKLIAIKRRVKFSNVIKEDCTAESKIEEVLYKPVNGNDLDLSEGSKKLFGLNNENEDNEDEAIPSFAAKHNVFRLDFPEHVVPFGIKIPAYKIPNDIVVDSCIKIFVSEIHSPFRFWFHLHKEENELDLLMFQIERYYSKFDEDELCIPLTSIMPGQVCAARYSGMWHRAEIVAPPVNDSVKVSFMDYGTVTEVKLKEIKFLASYFAQLPAQALRGCLSHIKPRESHWSHKATIHFLNLASDLMLYAKVAEIDTQNQTLYLIICNTYGDEVIQINKSLVEHQYARYHEAWKEERIQKNNGKRVHHPREDFPTFSMIESGEYPTFTELCNLESRGIDYEAIHDLVLYNQSSILNKHENAPDIIRQLPYFLTTTNPFRFDIIHDIIASNPELCEEKA